MCRALCRLLWVLAQLFLPLHLEEVMYAFHFTGGKIRLSEVKSPDKSQQGMMKLEFKLRFV